MCSYISCVSSSPFCSALLLSAAEEDAADASEDAAADARTGPVTPDNDPSDLRTELIQSPRKFTFLWMSHINVTTFPLISLVRTETHDIYDTDG